MAYNKELYDWYKENHICTKCGQADAAPHRSKCEECLAKDAERAAQRRERLGIKGKSSTTRDKYRELGLCIFCGKPRTPKSKCFCIDCFIKNNRKNKKRTTSEILRSERPAYGMCYRCGKPISKGKLCPACLKTSCKNLPQFQTHDSEWYARNKRENDLLFRRKKEA